MDLVDLSEFTDCSFDALVAYGGPLSYTLDKRQQALNEIHRVLQPGGLVLLSVMSLFGTMHKYLDGVFQYSTETNDKILSSGDLTEENINNRNGHYMHLFQSDELKTLLIKSGFHSISMSASNFISAGWNEELQNIRNSEDKWDAIKRWEVKACTSPGALDAGTHIIVAAYKS